MIPYMNNFHYRKEKRKICRRLIFFVVLSITCLVVPVLLSLRSKPIAETQRRTSVVNISRSKKEEIKRYCRFIFFLLVSIACITAPVFLIREGRPLTDAQAVIFLWAGVFLMMMILTTSSFPRKKRALWRGVAFSLAVIFTWIFGMQLPGSEVALTLAIVGLVFSLLYEMIAPASLSMTTQTPKSN